MLAIVGPTGSGKTALAMAVAERVGGEILSCDSVQVYQGFDIGSAKASSEEQARVRHHLVDVARWDQDFDAQQYRDAARLAIADMRARRRVPILCGGTGLYLRLLRWGVIDVPSSDPKLRGELEEAERRAPGATLARLRALDPVAADDADPHNLRHLSRALEICLQTGRRVSDIRKEHGFRKEEVPMRVVWVTREAEALRERIRGRVEQMLTQGLLEEVIGLVESGVDPHCAPMRAVGYREAVSVVLGDAERHGLEDRIFKSTWAYARRQRTWFRKERDLDVLELNDLESAVKGLIED